MADTFTSSPVIIEEEEEKQKQEQQQPRAAVKNMNVIFVQDVSGSMENQRISVTNGINEIIGDLQQRYKEPCEYTATVCIIKFSSHDCISVGPTVPVHEMSLMCVNDLKCDGMTALWDAAAIAIQRMNTESAGVPATTYIFTDGDNNDSKIYTRHKINEMIAKNKTENPMHSVLFIGSDPSARQNAENIGLDRVHSIQHDANATPVAYEVCRRALGRCVSGDTQSTEFNHDDIVMSETPAHDSPTPRARSTQHNDSQQDYDDDNYGFASDDVPSAMPSRAMSYHW